MTGIAVCVLGCRSGSPALTRRAEAAERAYRPGDLVVTCGGVAWDGDVEADALARLLEARGVPEGAIVRERRSRDTHENAVFAARILAERGIDRVVLVTCTWHLPRARRNFERAGLSVERAVGAEPPQRGLSHRIWWAARERVAGVKDYFR